MWCFLHVVLVYINLGTSVVVELTGITTYLYFCPIWCGEVHPLITQGFLATKEGALLPFIFFSFCMGGSHLLITHGSYGTLPILLSFWEIGNHLILTHGIIAAAETDESPFSFCPGGLIFTVLSCHLSGGKQSQTL